MTDTSFLNKYEDIIKEELNIKEIGTLENSTKISKIIKPLGSKLSAKFGKDTGRIIQLGKEGKIKENNLGQVIVFDENNERILENDDYEITYEWLDGDNIAIDNEIIAKLDFTMTPELIQEGIAREISRFLNQMRKDENYNVDDKINVKYHTDSKRLTEVVNNFWEFLKDEALISTLSAQIAGEETLSNARTQIFTSDNEDIIFTINR